MGDWIEWGGGKCPIPDRGVLVEVRLRSGMVTAGYADVFDWGRHPEKPYSSDITAYRLLNLEPSITLESTPEEEEAFKALEKQVGGAHYKDLAIQPIEYIHANNLSYCEANVVKYISRWRSKGGKQDLEKVKHYVDLLIQLEGL